MDEDEDEDEDDSSRSLENPKSNSQFIQRFCNVVVFLK